jgi:hypothetical protein
VSREDTGRRRGWPTMQHLTAGVEAPLHQSRRGRPARRCFGDDYIGRHFPTPGHHTRACVSRTVTPGPRRLLARRSTLIGVRPAIKNASRSGGATRPHVLLVLIDARPDAGGIQNVGWSLIRLLRDKQSQGLLDYRVAALHGHEHDAELRKMLCTERRLRLLQNMLRRPPKRAYCGK